MRLVWCSHACEDQDPSSLTVWLLPSLEQPNVRLCSFGKLAQNAQGPWQSSLGSAKYWLCARFGVNMSEFTEECAIQLNRFWSHDEIGIRPSQLVTPRTRSLYTAADQNFKALQFIRTRQQQESVRVSKYYSALTPLKRLQPDSKSLVLLPDFKPPAFMVIHTNKLFLTVFHDTFALLLSLDFLQAYYHPTLPNASRNKLALQLKLTVGYQYADSKRSGETRLDEDWPSHAWTICGTGTNVSMLRWVNRSDWS